MNNKSVWIAGIAGMFVLGMIATSSAFTDASEESTQKPSAPRYSETCAHGHNGFACKTPQYKLDISELQERTSELEQRVSNLEMTR